MSDYFKLFPTVIYNNRVLRDISLRIKINEITKGANYYFYTVRDSERPDTIANDYYGDSSLAWLVLLSNIIVDPYYEWPLSQRNFDKYITSKFESLAAAKATIVYYKKSDDILYYQLANISNIINVNEYNSLSDKSGWTLLNFDEEIKITTENYNLRPDKTNYFPVYAYEDELSINEQKRNIRLLNREHVSNLLSEMETLLNE